MSEQTIGGTWPSIVDNDGRRLERPRTDVNKSLIFWISLAVAGMFLAELSGGRSISAIFQGLAIWIILFVLGAIYLIPTFVTMNRKHRQRDPIMVLNIFLGWLLIGWVVALVWALTTDVEPPVPAVDLTRMAEDMARTQ